MKCLNCGEEIPKGMTSCKYCGHVVSLNSAKSAEEQQGDDGENDEGDVVMLDADHQLLRLV